jgi:dTDP-4-dehydrorhamnose 3,5-epimerase
VQHGLEPAVAQCSVSFNSQAGTLRGLHSQRPPFEEVKLVRCTRGAIYDVIVDLRADSSGYMKHFAIELNAENHRALYVPKGVYHGFLTLQDDTEIFYQISDFYEAGQLLGVRWNDTAFGISWPIDVRVISDRDAGYPDYQPRGNAGRA